MRLPFLKKLDYGCLSIALGLVAFWIAVVWVFVKLIS